MHDIDRGANPTAVRLAAMAALRKAQADSVPWAADEADETGPSTGRPGRGRAPRLPRAVAAPAPDPSPAPKYTQDGTAGVFAAVEAAVRKSRIEFVARLAEYRKMLDCDTFRRSGPDGPDQSMDEAQFVAHRIAGVGKTLGFADLGDAARQTEAAIAAYKLDRSQDLRNRSISRICTLAGLIETVCTENEECRA